MDERVVIVCGGRDYTFQHGPNGLLLPLPEPVPAIEAAWLEGVLQGLGATRVIDGGCKTGGDWIARGMVDRGFRVSTMYARWREHGRAAGPLRNEEMANLPDVVAGVAFPGGRGTADMVRRLEDRSLPVIRRTAPFEYPPKPWRRA